jgi:hypothetical protein
VSVKEMMTDRKDEEEEMIENKEKMSVILVMTDKSLI